MTSTSTSWARSTASVLGAPTAFTGTGTAFGGFNAGPGGHADQPAERGGRVPGDEHGAARRAVPAVPEREGRGLRRAAWGRSSRSRASGTSPARTGQPVPAADPDDRPARRSPPRRRRSSRRRSTWSTEARLRPRHRRGPHGRAATDWTTLPDLNGGTTTAVPAECEAGFLIEEHPFLAHYLTQGDPCGDTGTSGAVELVHRASRTAGPGRASTCRRTPASRSRSRSRT